MRQVGPKLGRIGRTASPRPGRQPVGCHYSTRLLAPQAATRDLERLAGLTRETYACLHRLQESVQRVLVLATRLKRDEAGILEPDLVLSGATERGPLALTAREVATSE
jgi:hypothetical protein